MQRFMTVTVFLLLVAYAVFAVTIAGYILFPPLAAAIGHRTAVDAKVLAALVSLVGTALTAITTIYLAHRQGLAEKDVARFKATLDSDLAGFQAALNAELERFRQEGERSLARRKVFLEREQAACLELWGSASAFFNALLAAPNVAWPFSPLGQAYEELVRASRHTVFVDDRLRDLWFIVLQEAIVIYSCAKGQSDDESRMAYLDDVVETKKKDGAHSYSFRDRVDALRTAAIKAVRSDPDGH